MATDTPQLQLLDRLGPWPLRVAWAPLPLLAGPTFAAALDPTDDQFRTLVSIGLWLLWAVTLAVLFVPRTVSLTLARVAVPAAAVLAVWAAVTGGFGIAAVVAVVATGVAAVALWQPSVTTPFVDGSAYGPEQRLPLRTPPSLLVGPTPLAWLATVVGAGAGPLLLASGRWVLGLVVLVMGWPLAYLGGRALHSLARRFVVLVPAGLVIHDLLVMVDPILIERRRIRTLRPAIAADEREQSHDLTLGAAGLVLAVDVDEPIAIGRRGSGGATEKVDGTTFLFTPAQPGRLLNAARQKRLPVAHPS